jgi:Outer membrane protein beta-barrel domain
MSASGSAAPSPPWLFLTAVAAPLNVGRLKSARKTRSSFLSLRRGATLAALGIALSPGLARAVGRDGQGRVELEGGLTWIPDSPFTQNARAAGYGIEQPYGLGPMGVASFGYWFDEHFEISIEGGYQHDAYSIRGQSDLTLDSEILMATLRWAFIGSYNFWPYVGASFGYSFNGVSSPFQAPWNSWSAVGYGEAAELGVGLDLSDHFGVSLELRYTLALLQSPFASSLNAGGLSLMFGVYLRIPRGPETTPAVPATP